uniref:Secreted protein n=1 Tax=Zea mays TaxID=4577 RepID=A0A804RAA1_MAIZE
MPKAVLEVLVTAACATGTAVGLGPLTTSCQYSLMCVLFSPPDAADAAIRVVGSSRRTRGTAAAMVPAGLLERCCRCCAVYSLVWAYVCGVCAHGVYARGFLCTREMEGVM